MAAQAADSIQKINRESTSRSKSAGALAHICLVNHSETKDNSLNGQISPTSAKAQNDDSDEDKDEDGGNIEGEAPEGKLAPGSFRTK